MARRTGVADERIDPVSDDDGVEVLSNARLEEILGKLRERPLLGGEEGVRLSLAGAQDKLAVCVEGDAIGPAKGGRPTTHILKPFIQALDGTVENELFCLNLAARLKLPVAKVAMRRSGAIPFLLVERYDRTQHKDGTITRLHQEDFCQALSVPPELKYEEEGGPGTERSLDLINRATARPAADRLAFIRMLIFHYLVGNADAHGKNYALLYRSKTPDLAPLYDVVCTAAYPRLAKKLAMAIGGHTIADTIQLKHWLKLVPDTRGAQRLLVKDMTELAGRIRDEADKLLAELEGTGITHDILKTIRAVIETRSTHLAYLPEEEFAPHLEEGRLTRVLEDWCPPFLGYHLYYPSRRQPSPAFLLVVDALRMEAPSRPTTERGTFAQAVPVDMRRPAEVVASR